MREHFQDATRLHWDIKHFPKSDCWNLGLLLQTTTFPIRCPTQKRSSTSLTLYRFKPLLVLYTLRLLHVLTGFSLCVSLLHLSSFLSKAFFRANYYPAFRLWAKHSTTNYTTNAEMVECKQELLETAWWVLTAGHLRRNQVKNTGK